MPRPETITDTDITRWLAEIIQIADDYPDAAVRMAARHMLTDPGFADRVFYSGAWLGEQLRAAGATGTVTRQICTAHGQRVAHSKDAWAEAERALSEWKAGRWEKPGRALALRLLERDFPTEDATTRGPNAPVA